jgi:hypothetical protein
MVNHIDDMRKVEAREDLSFLMISNLFCFTLKVDLEGIWLVALAADINTKS